MHFEWDGAKNASNIAKHGYDFLDGTALFDGPHLKKRVRDVGGEERWAAIGTVDGDVVTLVYTMRGPDTVRIISLRRARDVEREAYRDRFGGGGP